MRKHYLDNIRFATILLVMAYHVCYLFNGVGVLGGVAGDASLPAFDLFACAVYPWFMVLLFVVAGISARYALQKQTPKQFMKSKFVKLLIPSTLGLFVFQWLVGYLNVKNGGGLDEIPQFIRYPIFALSGTGPLWFAQLLFVFSALLLLLRKLDRSDRLWNAGGKCNLIGLLLLALPVFGAAQVLNMPVISTYRFGIYLLCYLLGYFVFSHDEIQDKLEEYAWLLLTAAAALGIGFCVWRFGENYASDAVLKNWYTNLYLWVTVLAVLGCAKKWFDRTTRFTEYMAKSSYGLYVLHYSVVLYTCYFLYTYASLPPILNYLIALVTELPLTLLLYEGMRRIPFIRFAVLGISKKKK